MANEWRRFTVEELSGYNGQNGSPIYVAYGGRVIDVTASRFWRGGRHMRLHAAGSDLSSEMTRAPHDASVLDRYPQVGVLVSAEKAAAPVSTLPAALERFLLKHPFFRRHPHPMTVHFPIVFMMFAPLFSILFLLTRLSGFEITAVNCLAAGMIFCVLVIPTGFLSWWINYEARPMLPVTVKIVVSLALFLDGLAALIWRLRDPQVLSRPGGPSLPYLLLVVLLLPMVVVVAWYGATLTFPIHREKVAGPGGQ